MIMVEVSVPALSGKYDFELDESTKVQLLIEEMLEMLCRKEKRSMPERTDAFCLSDMDTGALLDRDAALRDYHVRSGSRLILT